MRALWQRDQRNTTFQDYVVTIGCALIVLFLFVLFILLSSFLF